MPIFDKILLTEQARRFGFQTAAFEKVTRLVDVLRFLNEMAELRESLALKGGTAINLTVFNLPRLSVDIDLDFTGDLSKEETRRKRDNINATLDRYMTAQGYVQRDKSKRTHILDSFVYSYTNAAGNADNIKVEINYSLRCHLLPTVEADAQTDGAFASFPVRTLNPVEIFASKIVALSGRAAARDLYDLNNMVYFGLFDEPDLTLLRKCAVFYLAIAGDVGAQSFQFQRITDITPYKIRTALYPVIRNAERFDLDTAQKQVSGFLCENMALNEQEQRFLQRFAAGRYEPQLLFDDDQILERIAHHPMAVWRTQQIRQEPER
jgi:predicted nucleotidyltransferase component of viral defense system